MRPLPSVIRQFKTLLNSVQLDYQTLNLYHYLSGRIWNHRRGGGHKRNFRMIDWFRGGTGTEEPRVEQVQSIEYDPNRWVQRILPLSS